MTEEPDKTTDDDRPAGDTDGPGNVSVDEPTEPALKETDQDEFDKQADEEQ